MNEIYGFKSVVFKIIEDSDYILTIAVRHKDATYWQTVHLYKGDDAVKNSAPALGVKVSEKVGTDDRVR